VSAEEEIAARSDALFKTLLESAPDAMIVVDQRGNMIIVNGQAERMFGYERAQMLGRPIENLVPKRLRATHIVQRQNFAEQPRMRPMGQDNDLFGLRRDGSEFSVEISLSPVQTRDGLLVSSVIRDVTERRKMEIDLVNAEQQALRANKANSAFLAAASHDLRQPVQALSLLNGALRRTVKDERALQMIENQEASLIAMTNLLNSLLDISRLDAGAVTPDLEDFPIQRLIDRLSSEFKRQAQAKGLTFTSRSCNAVIRSDPNLLTEILVNLVSNAIRYTDKGQVQLSCRQDTGECRLDVTDSGIGIEADQLDEIFREFHQCKTPDASKEGFGLGLAIVRRLADLLEHTIDVDSEPGKGSRFTVSVPIVAGEIDVSEEQIQPEPIHSDGGLIVLVEDDVSVADAWCLLLEAEGYRVATAASAKEATALLPHLDTVPDLLLSDFHLLDGSTGVEAVAAIREYFAREIPAFVVSGDTSKVVKDARLLDNCILISKPVDTTSLLVAVQSAISTGKVPQI
jgi:PAS domain S-box-containing protein